MSNPALSMQPIHFGPQARLLFGVFHPAASGSVSGVGVVLCSAFGQEAVRAHRTMRVLAERLARAGHVVLRFDYYGTGDSMGDDADGDLDGWAGDIHEANRSVCSRSGVSQTVWIGMRLGGAVALQASRQAPQELKRLVLWDPVIDGRRYLEHLRTRHIASLEEAFSVPPRPTFAELALDPLSFRDEALGFALSPLMREQIAALRPDHHKWPARPVSIVAITDPDDADGRDLASVCAREPSGVQIVSVQHGIDWAAESAETGALVSTAALTALVRHAGSSE